MHTSILDIWVSHCVSIHISLIINGVEQLFVCLLTTHITYFACFKKLMFSFYFLFVSILDPISCEYFLLNCGFPFLFFFLFLFWCGYNRGQKHLFAIINLGIFLKCLILGGSLHWNDVEMGLDYSPTSLNFFLTVPLF